MDPPHSPQSQTTILDLNDDCLLHVIDSFKRSELVTVADICSRFRRVAQAQFAHLNSENKLEIGGLGQNTLFNASKVMRNFGSSIKVVWLEGTFDYETDQYYCELALRLLNRYGCESLIELQILAFDITDEIERLMRPLLQHLQILIITCCKIRKVFLNALPELAPELHELRFQCSNCYRSTNEMERNVTWQPTIPKLQKIQFFSCNVNNNTIDEFLRANPQLKNIIVDDCWNSGDQIFMSIAKHVPQIEDIFYKTRKIIVDPNVTTVRIYDASIKYFGHLKNLKSLALILELDLKSATYMMSVVQEIIAANIPLEHLHLRDFVLLGKTDQFVDTISKLKNLKTLKLKNIANLTPCHILEISTYLSELSELYFSRYCKQPTFTSSNILELIQNATKLQLFCCHDHYFHSTNFCIDDETFEQMVNTVKNRFENKPLKICLDSTGYTSSVPDVLARAHEDSVTLAFSELSDKCY